MTKISSFGLVGLMVMAVFVFNATCPKTTTSLEITPVAVSGVSVIDTNATVYYFEPVKSTELQIKLDYCRIQKIPCKITVTDHYLPLGWGITNVEIGTGVKNP